VLLWQERGLSLGQDGAAVNGVYGFVIAASLMLGTPLKRGIWDQRPLARDMKERRERLVG
jgi:hypothetical protein